MHCVIMSIINNDDDDDDSAVDDDDGCGFHGDYGDVGRIDEV